MRFLIIIVTILTAGYASELVDFEFYNNFPETIYVGIKSNPGKWPFSLGGFVLESKENKTLTSYSTWSGRIWPRTYCSSIHHCQTGDCGSRIACLGRNGTPPMTQVEFLLRGRVGMDIYKVSLVDGFNSKIQVEPVNGKGDCRPIRCIRDIIDICPPELRQRGDEIGEINVACKSACIKYDTDRECCRGQYSHSNTCLPDTWHVNSAQVFKKACPDAISFNLDAQTSTFTCIANRYRIIFG